MIKKTFLSIIFLVVASNIRCANPSIPSVVYSFYNSMKELSTETSASRAYDLQVKMQHCFLYGKPDEHHNTSSGISIPNDFYILGYNSNKTINSTLYTQIFKNKAFTDGERLKVEVNIRKSTYAKEVDLKKYMSENTPYIQTYVTKTFSIGNTHITFNDTILTKNNLIYALNNGVGSHDDGDNLETLRALAAQYNELGMYKKAFHTYEKISNIDPTNANAYYRMGILAFWYGKKCGFSSSKNSRHTGIEFMKKASELGFDRADTVLYYMIHPTSI